MGDAQQLVDALGARARREILWLLWEQELPAGEIAAHMHLSPATVSEHLAVLARAGLVLLRRSGTFRYYRADRSRLRDLQIDVMAERSKWQTDPVVTAEGRVTSSLTVHVTVACDVTVPRSDAFAAFTDPARYSTWLGVPVTIDGNRFSCTMENGIEVRGWYDAVVPDTLIAMRYDFDPTGVPLPGDEMNAIMRFRHAWGGSRVTVQQGAPNDLIAARVQRIWSVVLGRFGVWANSLSHAARPR